MPYFDYCSTLACYFSKAMLLKLSNCFNLVIARLFKITPDSNDLKEFNNKLEKYGLNHVMHRILFRLANFTYKIVNLDESPKQLKAQLTLNKECSKGYELRNKNQFQLKIQLNNHYGEATFDFFFVKFINNLLLNDLYINFNFFSKRIFNNINLLYTKFIKLFPKFKFC